VGEILAEIAFSRRVAQLRFEKCRPSYQARNALTTVGKIVPLVFATARGVADQTQELLAVTAFPQQFPLCPMPVRENQAGVDTDRIPEFLNRIHVKRMRCLRTQAPDPPRPQGHVQADEAILWNDYLDRPLLARRHSRRRQHSEREEDYRSRSG
jgi:hypothetical protein